MVHRRRRQVSGTRCQSVSCQMPASKVGNIHSANTEQSVQKMRIGAGLARNCGIRSGRWPHLVTFAFFVTAAGSGWCASAWRLRLFDEPSSREERRCHLTSHCLNCLDWLHARVHRGGQPVQLRSAPKPIMGTGKRGDGDQLHHDHPRSSIQYYCTMPPKAVLPPGHEYSVMAAAKRLEGF
jgi:hypothetical protein